MKSSVGKKTRPKSLSIDLQTTVEVNSIATKYMELLGGVKSFDSRNVAAFVPKQILVGCKPHDGPCHRRLHSTPGSKVTTQPMQSSSETTLDRIHVNQSLREPHRGVSRGVIMKGSTVTTEYKFRRKATHTLLGLRYKPPFPLYTRMHSALLLKRPDMRFKLKKISMTLIEDPPGPLAPWTFEKRGNRAEV